MRAAPAGARSVSVIVDGVVPDIDAAQSALRAALLREFAARGFRTDGGEMAVRVTVTKHTKGSPIANAMVGFGYASDDIDVRVELSDAGGAPYGSFVVRGRALDKRYSDIYGVVREMAKKIVLEVRRSLGLVAPAAEPSRPSASVPPGSRLGR